MDQNIVQNIQQILRHMFNPSQFYYLPYIFIQKSFNLCQHLDSKPKNMIAIPTGHQVHLRYYSSNDHRLRGSILLCNTSQSANLAYKIKNTDSSLFQAEPFQGMISPKQTVTIRITTAREVIDLSSLTHNKFLVESATIASNNLSQQQGLYRISASAPRSHHKIGINVEDVENSHFQISEEADIEGSCHSSYHSLAGPLKKERRSFMFFKKSQNPYLAQEKQGEILAQESQNIDKEIQKLEKDRLQLLKALYHNNHDSRPNLLLTIFILVLAIVLGIFVSRNYCIWEKLFKRQELEEKEGHQQDEYWWVL